MGTGFRPMAGAFFGLRMAFVRGRHLDRLFFAATDFVVEFSPPVEPDPEITNKSY